LEPKIQGLSYSLSKPFLLSHDFWFRCVSPYGFGTFSAVLMLSRWDEAISNHLNRIFGLHLSFVSFDVPTVVIMTAWSTMLLIVAFVFCSLVLGRRSKGASIVLIFLFEKSNRDSPWLQEIKQGQPLVTDM
jgi:hypothetical protein